LQRLIDWLQNAGYRNIYILDNDSTYPELLNYYTVLEQQGIKVVRLGMNCGHTAIWSSGILEQLNIKTPYVYTDSDIVPIERCPNDIVRKLLEVLRRYRFLAKAGPGIYCENITCKNAEQVKAHQKQFYCHPIEPNLYFGAIDTTFALYRNIRFYTLAESARTTGDAMIYHLPWHLDYDNLSEDEQYYIEHANSSATTATALKKGKVI
jgi:arginine deiminase